MKDTKSRNYMFWEDDKQTIRGKAIGVIIKTEDKEIFDKIDVTFVHEDWDKNEI